MEEIRAKWLDYHAAITTAIESRGFGSVEELVLVLDECAAQLEDSARQDTLRAERLLTMRRAASSDWGPLGPNAIVQDTAGGTYTHDTR